MGIENMRRWPMYIVFAVSIALTLSLFNSWGLETELRNKLSEISTQLQECSKQQTTCMENSLSLLQQKDGFESKIIELERQKNKLREDVTQYKDKVTKSETQVNGTLVDIEICKTELQSLKNLQVSKSATLETLRLEKDTLTTQLAERKEKIRELEKEIERLKTALTTKASQNLPMSSKVPPVVQPPNLNPPLKANDPNDPLLENDAKEEMEDNAMNDGVDFDAQLQ